MSTRKARATGTAGWAGANRPSRLVEDAYAEQKASGTYKGCDTYADFRELLARKDIDAVEVATPDHWHAIAVISACKAGKDIYGQKPLALTIAEGRAMSNAVKKYKRIFQTGSQQRSDKNFRLACELVRNGRIGKLQTVRCGLPGGRPDWARPATTRSRNPCRRVSITRCGSAPRPEAPYAPARCLVNFRWIYDYSGGQVTDWGGHHPDCAQWGMGTEYTGPIEIRSAKARRSRPTNCGTPPLNTISRPFTKTASDDRLRQGAQRRDVGRHGRLGMGGQGPARRQFQSDSQLGDRRRTKSICTKATTTTAISLTA